MKILGSIWDNEKILFRQKKMKQNIAELLNLLCLFLSIFFHFYLLIASSNLFSFVCSAAPVKMLDFYVGMDSLIFKQFE